MSTSGCMPVRKLDCHGSHFATGGKGGRDGTPALVMSHCCVLAPLHLALTTVAPLLESQQVAGALPTMPMAAAPGITVVVGDCCSNRRVGQSAPPLALHG